MTDLPEPAPEPAPETPPPETGAAPPPKPAADPPPEPAIAPRFGPAAAPPDGMFSPADPAGVAALAARPAPRMRRRNFFSDMPDRGLFIVFAGLGFIGILSLKLNGAQGWWTVAIPLVLMVTYAGVTWYTGMFRLHPDRLGDNCYYMGFLFTLASLTAALLEVDSRPVDARGTLLEALIGNFGVALLSTITGIALRVMFIQMHREVEEIEDQVRLELQDAAARLKDQLGMAVIDMESFRLRAQQMLTQSLDEANATFADLQRQRAANLQRVADEEKAAADALLSVQQRIAANLERAADLQSAATARIAAVTDTAVEGVEGLIRRIEAIDVPPDLLLQQIDAARERINALAVSLEDIVTADRARQAQFIRATEQVAAQMQGIVSAVAGTHIEVSAGHLQQAVETMANSVATLHAGLDRYAVSVERLSAATEAERAAMSAARGIIETDARHSTRALHELQATLVEIADAIVRRLEPRR